MFPLSRNTLQQRRQRGAKLGWAWRDTNSRLFHRSDLVFRATLSATDDRGGMHQPTDRTGGKHSKETGPRLLASETRPLTEDIVRIMTRATPRPPHTDTTSR